MAGETWGPGGAEPPAPAGNDAARHGVTTLRDFLRIAWRRKAIILICVMVTPLAAAFFSMRKPATYQAGAKVLLTRQDLGAAVNKIDDPTLNTDAERDAATQAVVARDPVILASVARDQGDADPEYARALLGSSDVTADEGTDI